MHAQVYYLLHNIFVTVAGHGLLDQKKKHMKVFKLFFMNLMKLL